MRDAACQSWVELDRRKPQIFLTGDLGFKALEPLREQMGERFINAGVAEQNMVSVAAGLASQGLSPWVYSIAPFCYARPFEQIRNDVCLHKLPVKMVGNGGGYAYGVMGATHHALEDYGTLLTLPHVRVFVPAFDDDVVPCVDRMAALDGPSYLRLGRDEKPAGHAAPPYAAWRRLTAGGGAVALTIGPLVGGLWSALLEIEEARRPELWVLSELPLEDADPPPAFRAALERARRLCVIEEHTAHGGAGPALAARLLESGVRLDAFEHVAAQGYPSGTYGSQRFHRAECGLDPASLARRLERLGGP